MTLRFFESAEEATSEVSDDDQDEPWTDQLSDFAVPVFASQPAINFDVPHDPLAVIFFFQLLLVMICGIILWPRLIAMLNSSFLNSPNDWQNLNRSLAIVQN